MSGRVRGTPGETFFLVEKFALSRPFTCVGLTVLVANYVGDTLNRKHWSFFLTFDDNPTNHAVATDGK